MNNANVILRPFFQEKNQSMNMVDMNDGHLSIVTFNMV